MLPEIEIAGREIGPAHPPLVVAEIGINHEGSLAVAMEMVDAAARAGVEVVKHQTHIVEDEMSGAARQVVPGNADVSIYEIMQRCALSEDDERQLQEYVESKGMIFISTPFSRAAADRLQRHERAGLQDRLRRVQQLPAAEAHRVVRQADHPQHRHEHDRQRRARPSRSSRAPACRTR